MPHLVHVICPQRKKNTAFKGSLTRDFRVQVYFIKFPTAPEYPIEQSWASIIEKLSDQLTMSVFDLFFETINRIQALICEAIKRQSNLSFLKRSFDN
jgi:hypothetical protein